MDEFARIAAIAAALGERAEGLGDDCAILDGWVVTVDACVEGVHFPTRALEGAMLEDVGYRATVAAASDVLAMGGEPAAILSAWTLPDWLDDTGIARVAAGQREACAALSTKVVGGNLARGPVLSLTTTVLGRANRPVRRGGARVGDRVIVCGALGEAALGLRALLTSPTHRCVAVFRRPPVLRAAAQALAAHATAMIDVSDGLGQDVGHLAAASGLEVELDLTALLARVPDDARALAASLGADLEQAVLAGGEDYALVAAWPVDVDVPRDATVVGECHRPSDRRGEGVVVRATDGTRRPAPAGHRHGRGAG